MATHCATLQQRLPFPNRSAHFRPGRVRLQPTLDLKPSRPGHVTLVTILEQHLPILTRNPANDAPDLTVIINNAFSALASVCISPAHGRITQNGANTLVGGFDPLDLVTVTATAGQPDPRIAQSLYCLTCRALFQKTAKHHFDRILNLTVRILAQRRTATHIADRYVVIQLATGSLVADATLQSLADQKSFRFRQCPFDAKNKRVVMTRRGIDLRDPLMFFVKFII